MCDHNIRLEQKNTVFAEFCCRVKYLSGRNILKLQGCHWVYSQNVKKKESEILKKNHWGIFAHFPISVHCCILLRNQSFDLQSKSNEWFYMKRNNELEWVTSKIISKNISKNKL